MKNRIALFLLIVALFSSCSRMENSAIVCSEEAEVYLAEKGKLVLIEVGREDLEYLEKISNLSADDVIADLFSLDAVSISDSDYRARKELYDILCRQTGQSRLLDALNKYGKDLRKTEFINTINELSSTFDDEKLLDKAIHADELSQYDLGPVLSYNIKAYEDVKAFIHLWREEVMR